MRIFNMTRVLQIEKSMRLHGQLHPVVARVQEGNYQIIDGFKRYAAAEDLMMEALQCRVLDIDLPQAKVLLLSYNRTHQSMEAWEEATVLQDLRKTHSLDQSSLAQMTGYSRSWVSRRLALTDKIDEVISSDIMMGVLTSSHARALTKLPRSNQRDVARVIASYRLSSRQSDALVEAFLKAIDDKQQRYILTHPEKILYNDQSDTQEEPYDERLSCYGNELMQGAQYLIHAVKIMLKRLEDERTGMLNETEKVIITSCFKKVSGYAKKLSEVTTHLQIHKMEATG
ncbi:MAG: ParB/RepB/Spo0J family partition protein [Anaerolineaceae bacterium]|nr:ParB/RepB/Spo0J family partition protein [Anaerolineaceae bacterium]